jgi:NAD(P)H dehydrogenase (quinone)
MHALVVVAHPNHDSFTIALQNAATAGLTAAGHTVEVLNLYAIGFQPAMTEPERLAYHSPNPVCDPLVAQSVAAIQAAEMLVFVYPTWWSGLPAMLKGWLEKCMVPGVAFVFDDDQHVRPGLKKVCRIVGISTYGSPRHYIKLINDNGRRTLLRALRLNTGLRTRTTWLGLYAIDASTAQQRQAFLQRVEHSMAKL